jgi:hypothetical protein
MKGGAKRSLRAGLWLLAPCLQACASEVVADEAFVIELRAISSEDDAVADVRFWADGRELGVTDEQGLLRTQLVGRLGQTALLTSACPPEYRSPDPERRLLLQRPQAHPRADVADFQLTTRCEPSERQVVVVVRTRGAAHGGMPIRASGQVVGQTEADGTAHLLLRARPHQTVRILLDTSLQPEILPRDPVQTLQLEDQDEVSFIDQLFEPVLREAPHKPARPRKPLPPAPALPYRIN